MVNSFVQKLLKQNWPENNFSFEGPGAKWKRSALVRKAETEMSVLLNLVLFSAFT